MKRFKRIEKIVMAEPQKDEDFLFKDPTHTINGSRTAKRQDGFKIVCDGEPDSWMESAQFLKEYVEVSYKTE
jgi:hypothetical protein